MVIALASASAGNVPNHSISASVKGSRSPVAHGATEHRLHHRCEPGQVGAGNGKEGVADGAPLDRRRRCIDDLVAEALAKRHRGFYGGTARRVWLIAHQRLRVHADTQSVTARPRHETDGSCGVLSLGQRQKKRAVPHAPAHAMIDQQPKHVVRPALSHTSRAGLEAEHTVHRCGDPNRPTAVAGVRHRHHPARHGGCRSARGAARRARQIPGIVRRSLEKRLRAAQQTELGGRRLADDDQAGRIERPRVWRAFVRNVSREQARAHRMPLTGIGDQVFHEKGYAAETPGRSLSGASPGHVEVDARERVHARLRRLDARDGCVDQLERADLTVVDERRLCGGVQLAKIVHHRVTHFSKPARPASW